MSLQLHSAALSVAQLMLQGLLGGGGCFEALLGTCAFLSMYCLMLDDNLLHFALIRQTSGTHLVLRRTFVCSQFTHFFQRHDRHAGSLSRRVAR